MLKKFVRVKVPVFLTMIVALGIRATAQVASRRHFCVAAGF
jgi:hypothetical protein